MLRHAVAHGSQISPCSAKIDLKHHKSDLCNVPKRFYKVLTY